jgi:TusA-related sulfurtransferase
VKTADTFYEYLKVRVDLIADARGIIFTDKLKFVEKALESLAPGKILCIYCSDTEHKNMIPDWLKDKGHRFLGIVDEKHYFKILIQKEDQIKFN